MSLPSNVVAASGNVSYTYDATGRKLQSMNGIMNQTRDYVDGIEYVDGTIELIQHAEGRILNTGSGYLFEYYLKDHLGNNRSGFGAGTNVTVPNFSADYYPFGMQYQQYVRTGNPKNNYLYNGKELQDGLKLYDYGARLYDPVIGRWGTMDPLAENHHGYNPYNYVLNNPMSYVDLFGLDTLGINSSLPIQEGDAVRLEDGSIATNSLADVQINALSQPSGTVAFPFYTGGEEVMDPVSGFWNNVLYTLSPRTYNGFEVDNSGRIKPSYYGGIVDIGLASRLRLLGVVAKSGQKSLNQFNSVESLIKAAQPTFGKVLKHGELQGFIKGNADAIFKSVTSGGTVLRSGAIQMSNGNIIRMYNATSTGASTIFINTPSQIFKIRITP